MNLNKALVVIFCVLSLLVVITFININRPKAVQYAVDENKCDEALMNNIRWTPEIIRSYKRVKEVYNKKNILFFRYAGNSCNTCLNSQLSELLSFQEEIGKKHVWIFPAYSKDRNSMIRLSSDLSKYNYINVPADSLFIPTYESEEKSYFAWINDEGEIDMVFIPDRSNVHYTRQYFLEVKRIIQNLRKIEN